MTTPRTEQEQLWASRTGRDYTERTVLTPAEHDSFWRPLIGRTRRSVDAELLADVPRDISVLEVGCNVGNQLAVMQSLGFARLYGVDVQDYALVRGRQLRPAFNIIEASALALPFKDGAFDLVLTSGVLIHMSPGDQLDAAMSEVHRVARRWVYGYEYFAAALTEIPWRGRSAAMWKGPYCDRYLRAFDDLNLNRGERVPYVDGSGNADEAFLLTKGE